MGETVKEYYENYHDRIADKRENSPFWIRRYAHRTIHSQFVRYLGNTQRVLDVGCGEGVLTCVLAQHGQKVVGLDMSDPNVDAARRLRDRLGVKADFLQGDAENIPFRDDTYDVVVSSHVLEHLPDLQAGLRELHRVTRDLALIAMPTCMSPACWVLLGGDNYWKFGRRTPFAIPVGLARTVAALLRGDEGPDEGYGPNRDLPHIWRFPWVMRRHIEDVGFRIEAFEPGPLLVPYIAEYVPLMRRFQKALDRRRFSALFRNFGYGSMAVCRKLR